MKLGALMATLGAPDPAFEGWVTNDDNVLAIDASPGQNAMIDDYTVVEAGIAGLDAQMNPVTQDKQYIRAGQTTQKTGTQRTFKVTGDRNLGDAFQDYALSLPIKYGVGNKVVVKYVYFCALNGVGERGTVSIIVNSDGSGNAGESAGIDIDLKKIGATPTAYSYTLAGMLGTLSVVSVAGSASGKTLITVTPDVVSGLAAVYETGTSVATPVYDEVLTSWTPFANGGEYAASAGDAFVVAYVDASLKARYTGRATAIIA